MAAYKKVTQDIYGLYLECGKKFLNKSSFISLNQRMVRVLDICSVLDIEYIYDGIDLYMQNEEFQRVCNAIENSFENSEGYKDLISLSEVDKMVTKKLGSKFPTIYKRRGVTPFDVPTEQMLKERRFKETLKKIGFEPITTHGHKILFKKIDTERMIDSFVNITIITEHIQEHFKSIENKKATRMQVWRMLETRNYYIEKYNLDKYKVDIPNRKDKVYYKEILEVITRAYDERLNKFGSTSEKDKFLYKEEVLIKDEVKEETYYSQNGYEKVTKDITILYLDLCKEFNIKSPPNVNERIDRSLDICNILGIEYYYDGIDLYIHKKTFKSLCEAIRNSFISSNKGYITFTEVNKQFSQRFGVKLPILYNVCRCSQFNIPTEKMLEEMKFKSLIEEKGFKPVTIVGKSVLFSQASTEKLLDTFVDINIITEQMQENFKHIENNGITKASIGKMLGEIRYYREKYDLDSYKITIPGKSIKIYYKEILAPMILCVQEKLYKLKSIDFKQDPSTEENSNQKLSILRNNKQNYNITEFCKIFSIGSSKIRKCIKEGIINANIYTYSNGGYVVEIPRIEVEKIKKIQDDYTSLKSIVVENFGNELESNLVRRRSNIFNFIKRENYFGLDFIDVKQTIFPETEIAFIKNKDIEFLVNKIKSTYISKLIYRNSSNEEKIKQALEYIPDNLSCTKSDIEACINEKLFSTTGGELYGWVDCTKTIGKYISKELYLYNNEDIGTFVSKVSKSISSTTASNFLVYILKRVRERNNCSFNREFIFNHETKKMVDDGPYSLEEMGRFSILVFNETHPKYKERLKLAIKSRASAGAWLYSAMLFVCGWRRSDLMYTLPRITLPTKNYKEFFKKVKDNEFTDKMAESIVSELELIVSVLELKPIKTEDDTNQDLILYIPESARRMIGLLLGLCEAHFQKEEQTKKKKNNKINEGIRYVTRSVQSQDIFIRVFGDEFKDIFGNAIFSSNRANKFHLINIAETAEKQKFGTGYIIASLARAHKFTINEKSNTTMIYLKYFKNLTNTEILLKELYERGFCSFLPYIALKAGLGENEITKLSLTEQTKLLKNLPHPLDLEFITKEYTASLAACDEIITNLIDDYKTTKKLQSKKELIETFIWNLCSSYADGKTTGTKCILRAQGKPCKYIKRENCIGCEEGIYLKTAFHVLGEKTYIVTEKYKNSKTKAEAFKYKNILQRVLAPILKDFIGCLKEIYNIEDISEYKKIYSGMAMEEL